MNTRNPSDMPARTMKETTPTEPPGSSTNMHETPGNHPPHVYETTPRTTRKHTLQGNRRNGKAEHTEPSHTHMILKLIPKGNRKRSTPPPTHHTPKPTLTPAGTASRQCRQDPAKERKVSPKRLHPWARDQATSTGRNLFRCCETVSWW